MRMHKMYIWNDINVPDKFRKYPTTNEMSFVCSKKFVKTHLTSINQSIIFLVSYPTDSVTQTTFVVYQTCLKSSNTCLETEAYVN